MNRLVVAVALASSAAAITMGGCGGISSDKAEDLFQGLVQQQIDSFGVDVSISDVTCPDDIENKNGTTFECTADLSDGTGVTGTCEVTNEDEGFVECRGETLEETS